MEKKTIGQKKIFPFFITALLGACLLVYVGIFFILKEIFLEPKTCDDVLQESLGIRTTLTNSAAYESSFRSESPQSNDLIVAQYITDGLELSEPYYPQYIDENFKKYQDDIELHQAIWGHFLSIASADIEKKVHRIILFTDGPANTLAYIRMSEGKIVTLGVDVIDWKSEGLYSMTEAFVHEIGHILMLGETQLYNTWEKCNTYIPSYGRCSYPDAYITGFFDEFWVDIYDEWKDADSSTDQITFYGKYQKRFINSYAATHIDEDMAETWSYFVLAPKPTGNTIPEEKVLFYYEQEELVELREELRNNICTYFDVPIEE